MERIEMIEELKRKAKVSSEEAEVALEKSNWDLLDAIIYLERQGKIENQEKVNSLLIVEGSYEEKKEENEKKKNQKTYGIGELVGRIFKGVGKLISKGNKNYFEIRKEEENPIKISLTISALLLIVGFWIVGVLLVVGLFCGYKYSIVGPSINTDNVNDILGKATKSAENIKNDFQEGYKNS